MGYLFKRKLLKNEHLFIADIISKDMKIEITHEPIKTKDKLLRWFDENWKDISDILVELSRTNHFQ